MCPVLKVGRSPLTSTYLRGEVGGQCIAHTKPPNPTEFFQALCRFGHNGGEEKGIRNGFWRDAVLEWCWSLSGEGWLRTIVSPGLRARFGAARLGSAR